MNTGSPWVMLSGKEKTGIDFTDTHIYMQTLVLLVKDTVMKRCVITMQTFERKSKMKHMEDPAFLFPVIS